MAREEILYGALCGAEIVDAAVLEEAAIFNGGDGLDEARGDFLEGDEAALGAVFIFREGRDEGRLKRVAGEGGAVIGGDGSDGAIGDGDGGAVS